VGNTSKNKTVKRQLGDFGEALAKQHYIDIGYMFVEANVQVKNIGEIDLIVSRRNNGVVEYIFSEVKTRTGVNKGYGYESVNRSKRLRMRKCAIGWLEQNIEFVKHRISWRLDVVSIDISKSPPQISLYENIEV